MEPSFNCSKVPEAVSAEKSVWQPHLSSAGVCETGAIAAKVAAKTKDDAEVIKSVYAVTATVIRELLAQGLRVVIDGLCRIELEPRGSMEAEDSSWDPAKNSIAAVVIPTAEIRDAATVTDIASEGHTGEIVSGMAFAAKGSGLDAFDAEAGDTVKVRWTQGGEDKEALIDPADIAADKMAFEFPDALVGVPMDTELTFEITFGEIDREKGSKLVGE